MNLFVVANKGKINLRTTPIIQLNSQMSNEFDKTNREINKQQTIRPDCRMYFITSAFFTKTLKLNRIPVFPLQRSTIDKTHFR